MQHKRPVCVIYKWYKCEKANNPQVVFDTLEILQKGIFLSQQTGQQRNGFCNIRVLGCLSLSQPWHIITTFIWTFSPWRLLKTSRVLGHCTPQKAGAAAGLFSKPTCIYIYQILGNHTFKPNSAPWLCFVYGSVTNNISVNAESAFTLSFSFEFWFLCTFFFFCNPTTLVSSITFCFSHS